MKRRDFLKGVAVAGAAVGSATTVMGPYYQQGLRSEERKYRGVQVGQDNLCIGDELV